MRINLRFFGGCGASSGIYTRSGKIIKYGTEYRTYAQFGRIKFVKAVEGSTTSPLETMTKNRIYVTLDDNMNAKYISFYDTNNKRNKLVEIDGRPHEKLGSQHTHLGYYHNEYGIPRNVNAVEKALIEKVLNYWNKRRKYLKK